jgi:hypothetical protein
MEAMLTGEGATRAADEALCIIVGRDLTETFPGYAWDVGVNHEAGVLSIRLSIPVFGGMAQPGFLMHIATAVGPGGQKKVRDAGGEVLERYRLRRDRAAPDWVEHANQNGLDRANMVLKSKF